WEGGREDAQLLVPDGGRQHFAAGVGRRGRALGEAWAGKVEASRAQFPALADQLHRMQHRELPDGWDAGLTPFPPDAKGIASRDSSGKVLNALAQRVPWLLGGSADLWPSTKTRLPFEGAAELSAAGPGGRKFHS